MKRNILSHLLLPLLCGLLLSPLAAEEKIDPMKIPAEEFLRIVRHAPARESWAKMSGTAMHKRDGAKRIKSPIRLAIRFSPALIAAKLKFGEKEQYELGQTFDPPVSTLDSNLKEGEKSELGLYGIDIRDLTLNFIYQDLLREEKPDRVSLFPCRVFMLKGTVPGQTARVYISTEYFFPVKVQWFDADPSANPQKEPVRELEIASVKKHPDNDFYLIPKLEIRGPTWRTRIDFDERDAGYVRDGVPEGLFN